ncbi:MAG: hypothetical protein ACE37F_19685 [Nannocystaceae bacterium]
MDPRLRTSPATLLILGLGACYSPKAPIDSSTTLSDTHESGSSSGTDTSSEPATTSTSSEPGDTTTANSSGTTTATQTTSSEDTDPVGDTSTGSTSSSCGDGTRDPGEECDDGNLADDDACSSSCEEQFFAGDSTPCTVQQSEVCAFLAGTCQRTQSPAAGGAVCFWEDYSDSAASCDQTPGAWTPDDAPFSKEADVHIPAPGVCINFVANLGCAAADQTTCDAAGATVCYQDKDVDGVGNLGVPICAWDVSQESCDDTPGLWTSAGSTFQQNHPNSVPPGADGACISQVSNF